MLQSIRDSKKGKDTYFGLFDINYVFDKNSGTWFSEEFKNINDDNTFVKGKGVSTNEVIRMLGLNAPEFQSLKTGLDSVDLDDKDNKNNGVKFYEAPDGDEIDIRKTALSPFKTKFRKVNGIWYEVKVEGYDKNKKEKLVKATPSYIEKIKGSYQK